MATITAVADPTNAPPRVQLTVSGLLRVSRSGCTVVNMTTTEDFEQKQIALQARIESDLGTLQGIRPGAYVYWALAHHVDSIGDIRLADLYVDKQRSEPDAAYGRIVLVLTEAVIVAEYEHAAATETGHPDQDFGRVSIEVRPLSSTSRPVVAWSERSLKILSRRDGGSTAYSPAEASSITVDTGDWSIALPGVRRLDGDVFFAEVLRAFDV